MFDAEVVPLVTTYVAPAGLAAIVGPWELPS
jgi:hypothetical protein